MKGHDNQADDHGPAPFKRRMYTRMNTLIRLTLIVCTLTLYTTVQAQNYAGHTWYFGTGTQGIRFSRSGNTANLATHSPLAGQGGSGVVSYSVNGDVLFYTDGINVYDATNAAMPSPSGLTADPSENQPVAVAQVPGSQTQYYIIARTATGDIAYATVDMSLVGNAPPGAPPLGDISASAQLVPGLTVRSEAMITVPNSDGTGFWLVTHAAGSSAYAVTPFTTAGPGPGTTVSYPNVGNITSAGNFAYHTASNKIAVTSTEVNRNAEIINFNKVTGEPVFEQAVPLSGTAAGLYDAEWSNSGQYLYLSGETGIKQFDLKNTSNTLMPVLPATPVILRSYGIQMGPDSAIYHLYEASAGVFRLGKITNSDTVATEVTYTAQAFPGNIDFDARQFPAFAPAKDPDITVSFTADGTCANAPTSFFPTVTPAADSLVWDLGDGTTSRDWSPVYTYTQGQAYTVQLTAYLNGKSESVSQTVTIKTFDTQITLVQDTTACSCELPFPKKPTPKCGTFQVTAQIQGSDPATWQWYGPAGPMNSGGGTSATLAPDSAGFYYLVATTASGCSTYAGVNIKEYGVQDQRANIWFFGDRAGLDFNPLPDNPVAPTSNKVMNALEGTATISDRNGQVIFFTDGNTVWNRKETVIADNISGNTDPSDPATESALIIPVPGDETLYYIFTTQPVYGPILNQYELRYTIYDVKMNGGTGGIVDPDNNPTTPPSTVLFTKSTERITGNENWLIAHEYGNNSFRAYRLTPQGIANPVITAIGSDHSYAVPENGRGYMKLTTQNRIAVALSTPGVSNLIELFDFTDSSGVVSNYRKIDLGEATGQVYGVEFSPSGQKLYASLIGNSKLFELAYDSATQSYTKRPEIPVVTPPGEIGAIQIGPDGNIYVATNGSGTLGTIQSIDDPKRPSTFNPAGQPLVSGTTSKLGLPNFIQTIATPAQGPGMNITGLCFGDSTSFDASGTDPIDKFMWYFGDGQSSSEQSIKHLYGAAGNYTVSLTITNRCGLDTTLTRVITINRPPADPTFTSLPPVLCKGPITLEAASASDPNVNNLHYVWSTGDTTRTIVADRQNNYAVTVTDQNGCTSDGSIVIGNQRPIVELGPDQTICQNVTVADLDASNRNMNYAWTINNVPSGTTRTQAVNTAVPGPPVYEYKVVVTDPITQCFTRDSVNFTINPVPVFTPVPTDPSGCGANDGSIQVTVTSPTTSTFSWTLTGPSTAGGAASPNVPVNITGLAGGAYSVTVADQLSGCSAVGTATLNSANFNVALSKIGNCDPFTVHVTYTGATDPVDYKLINTATGQVVASGTGTAGGVIDIANMNSATYVVELTDASATRCVSSSAPQALTQDPPVTVTFDESNICTNGTLTAVGNGGVGPYTFEWTPAAAITAGANTATATILPGTAWTLEAKVTPTSGACPGKGTTTILVDSPLNPNFTQSSACASQVTIIATPNGQYLYRWFRDGAFDGALAGPQITADSTKDNQQFQVTLYNPANGCTYSSPQHPIQVSGRIAVTLKNTFPCVGSPFTITASPVGSVVAYTWSYNGTVITGESGQTLAVSDGKGGTYRVDVTNGLACTAFNSITVNPAPKTEGNLSSLVRICPDPANPDPNTRQATLDPGTFQSYEWFKDGVSLGETTPTITVNEGGKYSVKIVNNFGCPSDDQSEVVENCDPVIVGPNAFRPSSSVTVGGDPVNQSFRLFTFFIDDDGFDIFIYNRWGEMIYHSTQRDFRWNGGYNNNVGQLAPAGTYTYVVRYKSSYEPEKGNQEKRGGVVLLR